MNLFDKICAVLAVALGAALFVLGLFGTVFGCRFWFTLPPVLGVLPAFAGWGIIRSVWFGWKYKPPPPPETVEPGYEPPGYSQPPAPPPGPGSDFGP